MDTDGGAVRLVAATASEDLAAFWSPDNTRISYSSEREGSTQIYVMHADGSNSIRLTGKAE
jgi:Tol biopolymer transport system component